MSLIFFILLILFVWFILLPALKVYRAYSNLRKQARDFFGGNPRTDKQTPHGDPSRAPKPKRKKIDPNIGEYVEFEEITVSTTSTSENGHTTTNYRRESQVTDVEWEDIR